MSNMFAELYGLLETIRIEEAVVVDGSGEMFARIRNKKHVHDENRLCGAQ
jgi:hypothetical protein